MTDYAKRLDEVEENGWLDMNGHNVPSATAFEDVVDIARALLKERGAVSDEVAEWRRVGIALADAVNESDPLKLGLQPSTAREHVTKLRDLSQDDTKRLLRLLMAGLSQGTRSYPHPMYPERFTHACMRAWEDIVEELENRELIDGTEVSGFELLWDKIGGEPV
jgi:hypothetical protein